jgi:abortive infection bacteriophage resistance protein
MPKIPYTKNPRDFEGQLQLLVERGLTIENKEKAKRILSNISYNRLSNYWYPLLKEPKEDELFEEGASFEKIFQWYKFDSELRVLVFHAIEQIEISLRTQVIYHLSNKSNSGFWYIDFENFDSYPKFLTFQNSICKGVQETKQFFITKYTKKYTQYMPPAWKSFELISFRVLISAYKNLKSNNDKIAISEHFLLHHTVFISWLETLVYIRNICAHHSRLWNIVLTIKPMWLKSPKSDWVKKWVNTTEQNEQHNLKIYAILCMLVYLLNLINPYHQFKKQLKSLIYTYNEYVDISDMGFPEDWKQENLWK